MRLSLAILAGLLLALACAVYATVILGAPDWGNPIHWLALVASVGISLLPVLWAMRYRRP